MARTTALISLCKTLETKIDAATEKGRGKPKQREPLRRELLSWLATGSFPDELKTTLAYPPQTVIQKHAERIRALASALYAANVHRCSPPRAAQLFDANEGDLKYAIKLAKSLRGVSLRNLSEMASPDVRSEVHAELEDLKVFLDQRAVEDLLLPAIEAYASPKPGKGSRYKEIYGQCYGTRKEEHSERLGLQLTKTTLLISRIVTQMNAPSTASEVLPNEKSEDVHLLVANSFFPYLELVGEYHMHPWKNLSVLRSAPPGWTPSKADRSQIKHWCKQVRAKGAHPRMSIIVAAAKSGKTSDASPSREDRNRISFAIDKYRFVVAAYRIRKDLTYDTEVQLSVPGCEFR